MTEQGWVLLNGDGAEEIPVVDGAELDRVLDQLTEKARVGDRPAFMHLYPAGPGFRGKPMLGFGIGESFSFLTFGHARARGNGDRSDWYYGNQWSELPAGSRIPVETAREAAREFIRNGARPTNVEWVEE